MTHLGMICIISSRCVFVFSTIDNQKVIYLCLFAFNFFRQCVSIAFQHALAFAIERKIVLVGDAYFRPPIIFKFHDLHVGNIRGVVGEIISYRERN
jgi:hypothetical protein